MHAHKNVSSMFMLKGVAIEPCASSARRAAVQPTDGGESSMVMVIAAGVPCNVLEYITQDRESADAFAEAREGPTTMCGPAARGRLAAARPCPDGAPRAATVMLVMCISKHCSMVPASSIRAIRDRRRP